ncbi:hypothetical protein EVAR_79686_1 [Eumeta japonica]|uniref:Uncharacterized protein n=1 Tax=Eumeta variegata TaxID=151549 RepID=A0A4C1TA36_EUMVA|nr:hypothetical protein EVAR_79686_1 [Eumeta japonica]
MTRGSGESVALRNKPLSCVVSTYGHFLADSASLIVFDVKRIKNCSLVGGKPLKTVFALAVGGAGDKGGERRTGGGRILAVARFSFTPQPRNSTTSRTKEDRLKPSTYT